MANRTTRTPKKEARFLEILRRTANVTEAAKAIRTKRTMLYQWRGQDEMFAKAWDDALSEAMDTAEGELYRRAVEGTLKPVFYKGLECGAMREYSDTLLIFMLKAHKPEKYRERMDVNVNKRSDEDLIAAVKDGIAKFAPGLGGDGAAGPGTPRGGS